MVKFGTNVTEPPLLPEIDIEAESTSLLVAKFRADKAISKPVKQSFVPKIYEGFRIMWDCQPQILPTGLNCKDFDRRDIYQKRL